MKIIEGIKTIGGIVVGIGAGSIVSNIATSTMPVTTSKPMKWCIKIASIVLGGTVGAVASKAFKADVDEIVTIMKDMVNKGKLD